MGTMGAEPSDLTSYDEVPYEGASLAHTHPARLEAIGRLFGAAPAPAAACRYLELACGLGSNVNALAYGLPGSQFFGVDLARTQVDVARTRAAELGLGNVEFRHMDITDAGLDLGTFDYIVAYGVYSWVSPEVQRQILRVCRELLSPQGLAFVSYNTYPGWHMRGAARDMLLHHAKRFETPAEQAAQARALLEFIAQGTAAMARTNPSLQSWAEAMENERQVIASRPDFYLLHEHLEHHNEPVYFHTFAERVQEAGLQYLADAQVSSMLSTNLPDTVTEAMGTAIPMDIEFEQYRDFLVNRTFRQSILCRPEIEVKRTLEPARLRGLYARTSARWLAEGEERFDPATPKLRTAEGAVLSLSTPEGRAAMADLIASAPHGAAFDLLVAAAAERCASTPEAARAAVGETVLLCYAMDVVDLWSIEPTFVDVAGERPVVRATARREALRTPSVTNAWHERVELDPVTAKLLPYVDGSRDRENLATLIAGFMAELSPGLPANEASGKGALEATLQAIAATALLEG